MDPNYQQQPQSNINDQNSQNNSQVTNMQQAGNQNNVDKTNKKTITNPYSSQNTLEIAEIRDGIVILKDGSFRAVVSAEAINFDLMSQTEREAIEYAYQGFLNSLYFPIQINIQSRKINSQLYIRKIQSHFKDQNNMLLSALMNDYLNFLNLLIENTDIMNKNFYIIIPFYNEEFSKTVALNTAKKFQEFFNRKPHTLIIDQETLSKAKKELSYRSQNVIDGLMSCGVRSRILDTQELISLYYEYYNPGMNLPKNASGRFDEIFTLYVKKQHQPTPSENNIKQQPQSLKEYTQPSNKNPVQPSTTVNNNSTGNNEPQTLEPDTDIQINNP